MFDQQRQFKYCTLPSGPYGIDYIPNTCEIVVTLPDSKEIAFISDNLTIEKQLHVLKQYWAIAYDKCKLTLVCCSSNPASIDILYDGVMIKTLGLENERRPLFSEPEYITVNCNQNFVVSDWQKKSLFCCDSQGNLHTAFTGDFGINQLQCPLGVTIDSNGFIYLADKDSNRIYRFSPDVKFDCIFLSNDDRINQPIALAFDSMGNLLVTEITGLLKLYG